MFSGAAEAQPATRLLEVPARASWQHAETRMILPPRAAALNRLEIRDNGDEEVDVVAQYGDPTGDLVTTIYLYRTMVPDASLWFDRALSTLLLRPGQPVTAIPVPVTFARPGEAIESGLRTTIGVDSAEIRSTALAVVPLGDWLVKVRMSSARLDPAALDGRLTEFIQALRWPRDTAAAPAARPIQPCERPLRLRRASIVRDDLAQVLINSVAGAALQGNSELPPPVYCREGERRRDYGVYRPDGATNRYLVALGDAGIALLVGRSLDISELNLGGSGRRSFAVTLLERRGTAVYPSFNRLPPPDQAVDLLSAGGSVISTRMDK
jgi:hypothetical protein